MPSSQRSSGTSVGRRRSSRTARGSNGADGATRRRRSGTSASSSRRAAARQIKAMLEAPFKFSDDYLSGEESSGDEGAFVGGALYPSSEKDSWALPLSSVRVETAENRNAFAMAICGDKLQVGVSAYGCSSDA